LDRTFRKGNFSLVDSQKVVDGLVKSILLTLDVSDGYAPVETRGDGNDLGKRLTVYSKETTRNENKFDFYAFDNIVSASLDNLPKVICQAPTQLVKLVSSGTLENGGGGYFGFFYTTTASRIYFAEYP
jgi:hypothetical protein